MYYFTLTSLREPNFLLLSMRGYAKIVSDIKKDVVEI